MYCKICKVEFARADLVNRRCKGCREAKEATDRKMHYGAYIALIDPPKSPMQIPVIPEKVETPAIAAVEIDPAQIVLFPERDSEGRRICRICGNLIPKGIPNTVTCGDAECVYQNERRRNNSANYKKNKGKKRTAICLQCGKEFTVSLYHKVTCSDECRKLREAENVRKCNKRHNEIAKAERRKRKNAELVTA